jgi:hypothetical protein
MDGLLSISALNRLLQTNTISSKDDFNRRLLSNAAPYAVTATMSGALATWFSQQRNRRLNIMPKIGFFRDAEKNQWYIQNFGKGAAQKVIFAEYDANNHLKYCIRLNPVMEGDRVYFAREEFKHCITFVANIRTSRITGTTPFVMEAERLTFAIHVPT